MKHLLSRTTVRLLDDALPKYKISVTNLSTLSLPDCCHLCWLTLATTNWKRPFVHPMPGVMQYHDRTQKWLLARLLRRDQKLPEVFRPFHKVIAVAPIGRLEITDRETGLFVYGYPDVVLENESRGVFLIDNKTAEPKGDDSPLFYPYRAQCNLYAHQLAKGAHARRVDGAALIYFRRPNWLDDEIILDYWDDSDGVLCAPFEPVVRPVDIDFEEYVRPLMDLAYELLSGETRPEHNPSCPDCEMLATFLKAQAQIQADPMHALDSRERERFLARQKFLRVCKDVSTVEREQYIPPSFGDPHGVVANWDFVSDCDEL